MLIRMLEKPGITDAIVNSGVSRFRKDFCESIACVYNKGIPDVDDLKNLAIYWNNLKLGLETHDLFVEIEFDINDGNCTVPDTVDGEGIVKRSKDALDLNVFGNEGADVHDYQALHYYNTMMEKRGEKLFYMLDILVEQNGELNGHNSFNKDELADAIVMWVHAIAALKLWMIETFQVYLHKEGKMLSSIAYWK